MTKLTSVQEAKLDEKLTNEVDSPTYQPDEAADLEAKLADQDDQDDLDAEDDVDDVDDVEADPLTRTPHNASPEAIVLKPATQGVSAEVANTPTRTSWDEQHDPEFHVQLAADSQDRADRITAAWAVVNGSAA